MSLVVVSSCPGFFRKKKKSYTTCPLLLLFVTLLLLVSLQLQVGYAFQSAITTTKIEKSSCRLEGTNPFSSSPTNRIYQFNNKRKHNKDHVCLYSTTTTTTTTSANFAMEPDSDEALEILQQTLSLDDDKCQKLAELASKVVEWNERINLVSRKDCTVPVVFGRHVLPCLALLSTKIGNGDGGSDGGYIHSTNSQRIVDVGTGGGFPGLPLAIANPQSEFLLVDSVGKKLIAVQEMANELGLTNVKTHHGRAEDLLDEDGQFDICVGRSVAAIPKYCLWIQHLLKKQKQPSSTDSNGKLLYMIGGEIDEDILNQVECNMAIDQLLNHQGVSDKNILVFDQTNVTQIAASTGIKVQRRPPRPSSGSTQTTATQHNNNSKHSKPLRRDEKKKNQRKGGQSTMAKGQWKKRGPASGNDGDSTVPKKQRGYENFQRFDSSE